MGIGAQKTLSQDMGQRVSFMDRVHARLSGMRSQVTGFVYQPEPRSMGSFAKGKQLIAGNFQFGGHLIQQPGVALWDLPAPDATFANELMGFGWLDDLAAVGDGAARKLAQDWTMRWIAQHGRGKGGGWSPDLTGRRLVRWINHAIFLMNGQSVENNDKYFRSLAQQTAFLSRRWSMASPGLPRFEALTGLLYAGISLNGVEHFVEPTAKALEQECNVEIDAEGGFTTRNPEELMEVFTLLCWAELALKDAGHAPEAGHKAALERIAPTLRALRHTDGGLARFHGGGRGDDGRLDQALANVDAVTRPSDKLAMGYARLSCGRTSVVADVSAPPKRKSSLNAHASTLAFELTSARRPVIVNCGSGESFGPDWRRAGRATPSHSTVSIDGVSSAKLAAGPDGETLTNVPAKVPVQHGSDATGMRIMASHDGYIKDFGLTHVRKLELSADGRVVTGQDTLGALSDSDRVTFEHHMDRIALDGVRFSLRFHLHPDVDASVDMGGSAISLALKSGEIWVFRPSGTADMALEPSVYLEKGRLKPRASQQIVLSSRVMEYAAQVSWVLAKAQDTPSYLRDFEQDLQLALDQ
ncbi:heparinase II/III family protein [uncultured Litoreibacter sp.]|uniref:heparinase II/III family protein n=1 Tax=uncultured Litoreibacter sp. TaxID=1392394 RepID=UPI002636DF69|nr:heparinase II/III family protein [uncultured Litoreibacter sp.]